MEKIIENRIVELKPMTNSEIRASYDKWHEEKNDIWIDFSEEKIEKALFLDIDGVIQPFTQYRFEYLRDEAGMEELYKKLEMEFGVDYREFNKFDVAATYYDWDKDALSELKRVLDVTGAKIVLSSDWRSGMMGNYMPFLMRIHDLQKYLHGYTPVFYSGNTPRTGVYEGIHKDRAIEILEYLRIHPHIKKWVAVDDIDMISYIPENFVETRRKLTTAHADRCIEILGKIEEEPK
jgi:hypothetical protein